MTRPLYPREIASGIHWMDPRASLDDVEKILDPTRTRTPTPGRRGEDKNLGLPAIEFRPLGRPTRGQSDVVGDRDRCVAYAETGLCSTLESNHGPLGESPGRAFAVDER
jgi:hypothetical protein